MFFLFFILGLISVIGQVIILREVTATFYGNEFFIGVVLASWIGWIALGTLGLIKFIKKSRRFLCFCFLLAASLLPLEILIIRLSKNLISQVGEIPNLALSFLLAIFITAPLPLILGVIFPLANRVGADLVSAHSVSRAYLYEIIGFISGGLAFYFVLIWINEFKVAFFLGGLAILTTLIIRAKETKLPLGSLVSNKLTLTLIAALVFFAVSLTPISNKINFYTSSLRFPSQKLAELTNSLSGNIAVTEIQGQYNFYENGIFVASNKEKGFSEMLAHFPLLAHPHPQKVLLVGSGASGAITEILKHEPSEVTWVELDPKLIELSYKYAAEESKISIDSPLVKSISTDGRYFLTNTNQKFDAIILNLPDPSTALLNRFYTQEFFEEAKEKLTEEGILAFYLSSSPNYLNPSLRERNALIYQTLKKVFASVIILPEEEIFFIACRGVACHALDPEILIERLKERDIKTGLVTPSYIKYRLTNERVEEFSELLGSPVTIDFNRDFKPHGYFFNALYWQSFFYPKLVKFFGLFLKIKLWQIILVFGLIYSFICLKIKKFSKNLAFLAMTTGGFSLMASEILLIYLFQVTEGYIYHKIALLITTIMAGIALGNFWATRRLERKNTKTGIIKIHLAIISWCLFLSLAVILIRSPHSLLLNSYFLILYSLLIGFIVGMEFPLANQLFFRSEPEPDKKTGVIYGADVLGSSLGAILLSLFFIPILGIPQTLLILAFINILVLLIIKFSRG